MGFSLILVTRTCFEELFELPAANFEGTVASFGVPIACLGVLAVLLVLFWFRNRNTVEVSEV